MAKYILLECNRLRGNNTYKNLSESEDNFKNKWINLVSPSGIVVNVGDTLSVEEIIVNSRGASDEVMEINATENENGFLDNQALIGMSFYINHIARNTARMPFIRHAVYRGQGTVVSPMVSVGHIGPNYPAQPTYQPRINGQIANGGKLEDVIQDGTEENLRVMLSRRSLGETFFRPVDEDQNDAWNPDKLYYLEYYCEGSMLLRMDITTIGTGKDAKPNTGYVAGIYQTTVAPAGGTGLTIEVLSVKVEGSIGGIIDEFRVLNLGVDYNIDDVVTMGTQLDGTTAIDGTPQDFKITNFPDLRSFQSSDIRPATGERFYYSNDGYTGLTNELSDGANESDPDIDAKSAINEMNKRIVEINFEAKGGFLTPDNLATLLTDQLHEPTRITETNNVGTFVDMTDFQFNHRVANSLVDVNDDTILLTKGKPVLVETPTYKPIPTNFDYSALKLGGKATVMGARRGFYAGLAYKDADRLFALKNLFYNFIYEIDDTQPQNDIISGTVESAHQDTQIGDFGTQGSGNLGVRVCLLNTFRGANQVATIERNSPIVTNMVWNEANLQRIAKNFRKAEEYMGDITKKVDTDTFDYTDKLCVNLDLGMYDDEFSTQGILTESFATKVAYGNQRLKFQTFYDGTGGSTKCEVPVDQVVNGCVGFQRGRTVEEITNDGQQLSSIWVKSRFSGGSTYKGGLATTEFMAANAQAGSKFDTNNFTVEQVFNSSWTDENGNPQTINDATKRAKELDIMVVPVFGLSNNPNFMYNTVPFIAFTSPFPSTDGQVWNPIDPYAGGWKCDFFNSTFGTQIGFDPSFTRNEAVCSLSPMAGNSTPNIVKQDYMNLQFIGAVNPAINFDASLSRFAISNFNTQTTVSNGLLSDLPITIDANATPEQPVIKINRFGQICPQRQKWLGLIGLDEEGQNVVARSQFDQALQQEGTIFDSQSGISIETIKFVNTSGIETEINNTDTDLFNYSLLDKMGFELKQLLPLFGGEQASFTNDFIYQVIQNTYQQQFQNTIKPMTTGSYVSSAEIQTLSTNTSNMPMYDLGVDAGRQVVPSINAAFLTAFNLPIKLSYPYLCVYSSLPSGGTDTEWIGGGDGHSKTSCMAYLTRNENEGDFFYTNGTTFNFTATKDFTISEIETDLRLPDGSRPKLEPQSCVIYKITKPIQSVAPENQFQNQNRKIKK